MKAVIPGTGRQARAAALPRRPAPRGWPAGVVACAAIGLLATTGGRAITPVAGIFAGSGERLDALLAIAMLLNIALMLILWSHRHGIAIEAGGPGMAGGPPAGLVPRHAFGEAVTALIATAERRGTHVTALMVALGRFTPEGSPDGAIDERRSGAAGDEIVRLLPPGAVIARSAGDGFVCAVPDDPRHPGRADRLAGHIVARLALPFGIGGSHAGVAAAVGLACSDPDRPTADMLMRRAGIALHLVTREGGCGILRFDAAMAHYAHARAGIERGLRDGIAAGEIVPYYEQRIDLATDRLLGFEVLARWRHAGGDVIPPGIFIPIAEEAGLIADLSLAVMRQAFVDAAGWSGDLTLAVHISPSRSRDAWFAHKIVKLLVETGFPPHRLEIGITERALTDDPALVRAVVVSLRNQGIRIALDDVGAGRCSPADLRALPIDRLRIDRGLVGTMIADAEGAAAIAAIIRLGDSLGVPVTAGGIEDGALAERLRTLGCHHGQGRHYGRPLPIMSVRKLLADRSLLASGRGFPPGGGMPRLRDIG